MQRVSRQTAIVLGLSSAAALVVFLRTAWISDDAYITLRTVRNLLEGFGPVYNIGERVQAYTHPLWFLLLTLFGAVTRELFLTTIALSIGLTLGTVGLLVSGRRSASLTPSLSPTWIVLTFGFLLSSRAFVDYSTSGLENPLTHLLVVGFFLTLAEMFRGATELREPRATATSTPPPFALLGAWAGLAMLNRIDIGLLLAPGLAAAVWSARGGRRLSSALPLLLGFIPLALWEIFSLIYYGALVPNTALAKLWSGVPSEALAQQGLRYFANSFRLDPMTLSVILLAVVVAIAVTIKDHSRRWEIAAAAGILLYLRYVERIGGDFMSGRFFTAPYVVALLVLVRSAPLVLPGSIALGQAKSARRISHAVLVAVGVLAIGIAVTPGPPGPPGFFAPDFGSSRIGALDESGIADERRYYFAVTGLFNGRPLEEKPGSRSYARARSAAAASAKAANAPPEAPVLPVGSIGTRGFQVGSRVHVLDVHALSDPLLARLPCVLRDEPYLIYRESLGLSPGASGWRIGHFRRNPPPGYLATLISGDPQIQDPRIASLYREVRLMTRGPLFTRERWRAITASISRGRPETAPRPNYAEIDYGELLTYAPNVVEYLLARARVEIERGNYDAAEPDVVQAATLDRTYLEAVTQLAQIRLDNGDLDRAIALLEAAVRIAPNDSELARALARLGALREDAALQDSGGEGARRPPR